MLERERLEASRKSRPDLMTNTQPVSQRPGRSNIWGAIATLVLEAAVVAGLAGVGIGVSALFLWLAG